MSKRRRGSGATGLSPPGFLGGGGGSILDRNLLPRVEYYALSHDIADLEALSEHLRKCHKEYARVKIPVLRQMVERAVLRIQEKGGATKPEVQLQSLEQRHFVSRGLGSGSPAATAAAAGELGAPASGSAQNGTSSGEDSDASNSGGSDGSSSEPELDEVQAMQIASGGLNSALTNMYARSGAAAAPSAAVAGSVTPRRNGTDAFAQPAAPFAASALVAAAAARALEQEHERRQVPRPAAAVRSSRSDPVTDASPSTSGHMLPATPSLRIAGGAPAAVRVPQAAATEAMPVPAKRGTEQAGLNKGRTPAKRARTQGTLSGQAKGSSVTAAKGITYNDLGGIEDVLADIREVIEYPLKHPEVYAWLGVEPPRGVLLHGPPGCGKTALANAIANECGVPFLRVSAPEIVSGMSGESEAKLRALFQEAVDVAPCIVFIDEIDAIFPKRETAQREMERRIVAQMLTCMDDLSSPVIGAASMDEASMEAMAPGDAEATATPEPRPHVVVIGATNRPDALDAALRRAGRFDREIALGIPTEAGRAKILQVLARRLRLAGDFDFHAVARRTPGFVGADLTALIKEAAAVAVTRIFSTLEKACQPAEQPAVVAAMAAAAATAAAIPAMPPGLANAASLARAASLQAPAPAVLQNMPPAAAPVLQMEAPSTSAATSALPAQQAVVQPLPGDGKTAAVNPVAVPLKTLPGRFGGGPLRADELTGLSIMMADFDAALPKVQPSVRREGFTTTPDVTWEDVGSLDEVRDELTFSITQPIMHPQRFAAMGLAAAAGVLLYGPPGCGKTLVAKAAANESGANFISIKGPELLNKYVGESERAVRQLFQRARAAHPCVLFFDEMDALAPRRGSGDTNQAAERVVNQLLTEMDGVDGRAGVYIVAATNRPDIIDPALLRPGRLDKVLYVPLPPPDGRAAITRTLTRRTPLAPGTDVTALAAGPRCAGFSGADLAALVREACVLSLKESMAMPGGHNDGAAAPLVHLSHFESALGRVAPSVSRKDQRLYDALRFGLRSQRGRLQGAVVAARPCSGPAEV